MRLCCYCRTPQACHEKGCFVGLIDTHPTNPVDPGPPERKGIFRRRQRSHQKMLRERRKRNQ